MNMEIKPFSLFHVDFWKSYSWAFPFITDCQLVLAQKSGKKIPIIYLANLIELH